MDNKVLYLKLLREKQIRACRSSFWEFCKTLSPSKGDKKFFSEDKTYLKDIANELQNLVLHCFGHIHGNYGVIHKNGILYSNGAILDNNYKIEVNKIYINFKI